MFVEIDGVVPFGFMEILVAPLETWIFAQGVLVPIPRLPFVRSRIFSTLFVRNVREKLSVVPTKLLFGSVPAFPAIAHGIAAAPVGVCQVARPTASDISIFPAPGTPPRIRIVPFTSNVVLGALVAIPIFHPFP